MIVENKNKYVSIWLLLITFLLVLMIIVGGLTRLTDSGLSITKWNLFTGILPPLSLRSWQETFLLYQQIPEYKLINSSMTLKEFKIIYWWEYIHRLLGRIIGLSFLIPLIYFTYKKSIKKNFLVSFYIIFCLILLQGFVGWYMVQSGLSERANVSQYRLSLHLSLAFIILILVLWNYLKFREHDNFSENKKIPFYLPNFLLFFIFIQIGIGAFVSGLDSGKIYQSWPLMDQTYFPSDSNFKDLFSLKLFETPSLLQFIHRNVAYFILIFFFIISAFVFLKREFIYLRKNTFLIFLSLLIQIFLGIATVISGAQIIFASMHQIGSIFLITTSLILVFKNSRIN